MLGRKRFATCSTASPLIDKRSILEASLEFMPSFGWTDNTLAKGALDCGLPATSYKMIERGPVELVEFFLEKKRLHVREQLAPLEGEKEDREGGADPLDAIAEHLERSIVLHMEYIVQQGAKKSWASALALLSNPRYLPATLTPIEALSNDLCETAELFPSRSDWYTERFLLLSLYTSSELFFLTDRSANLEDTRFHSFLLNSLLTITLFLVLLYNREFIKRSVRSYIEMRRNPSLLNSIKAGSNTVMSFVNSTMKHGVRSTNSQ